VIVKTFAITYGTAAALVLAWIGVTRAVGWLDYPMWLALLVGLLSLVVGHLAGAYFSIRARDRSPS
jgi:vacuolar-type H+-ATPase subunit I/STV1